MSSVMPCPYCTEDEFYASKVLLMTHIRIVHSMESGFSIPCSVDGCRRTLGYIKIISSLIAHAAQGGLWGLETPPPEIYQGSQKNDVLV